MQWILLVLLCSLLLLLARVQRHFIVCWLADAFLQHGINIWVWSPSQQCCPCCSQWLVSWAMEVVLHGISTLVENSCWLEWWPLHQFRWVWAFVPLRLRFFRRAHSWPDSAFSKPLAWVCPRFLPGVSLYSSFVLSLTHWGPVQIRKGKGPVDGLTRIVSAAWQVLESQDSGVGHGVRRFRDQTRDQYVAKLI